MNKIIGVFILVALTSGCATITGPSVSPEEIKQAKEGLEVKSLAFRLGQIKRINTIGHSLVRTIPKEDIKGKPQPFLGLFCIPRGKVAERLFNIHPDKGIVVAFILEGTPAYEAGLKAGDVVLAVGKKNINHVGATIENGLTAGEKVELLVLRNGQTMDIPIKVSEIPFAVSFTLVDDQSVNAAAGTNQIFVTYGLINFAKSDDEIAAVIGHELGHLTRGHVMRMQGSNIISIIAAIGLGIAAETVSPGSGSTVMRGVGGIGDVFKARFSRDLEREADYFGVKYLYLAGYDPQVAVSVHERFAIEIPSSMTRDFFSSHPSSPERSVRIKKTIEELHQLYPLNKPSAHQEENVQPLTGGK